MMAENGDIITASVMEPPRTETGVIGWVRTNLFSTWYDAAMTVISVVVVVWFVWFGLTWVFGDAEWRVIGTLGGQFIIGQFNTESACPGQNCFWRPQVSLLLATMVLGMAWGIAGGGTAKRVAITVAVVAAALAFIPYSFERMGDGRARPALGEHSGDVRRSGSDPLYTAEPGSPRRNCGRRLILGDSVPAARNRRPAGDATGVGHPLGRIDVERAAGGCRHRAQPPYRHRAGAGQKEPASGREAALRSVHRNLPWSPAP